MFQSRLLLLPEDVRRAADRLSEVDVSAEVEGMPVYEGAQGAEVQVHGEARDVKPQAALDASRVEWRTS